jgi:two-component sensor histidine kinase
MVTNALKHAFAAGVKGTISVTLRRERSYILAVGDNGKGCPKSAATGLGSQLVELLVRQLHGRIERMDAAPGCRIEIQFPDKA